MNEFILKYWVLFLFVFCVWRRLYEQFKCFHFEGGSGIKLYLLGILVEVRYQKLTKLNQFDKIDFIFC